MNDELRVEPRIQIEPVSRDWGRCNSCACDDDQLYRITVNSVSTRFCKSCLSLLVELIAVQLDES